MEFKACTQHFGLGNGLQILMNQKIGKKQKKKQKAKEKLEENQARLNKNSDRQEKVGRLQVSYQKIPVIKTIVKNEESESSNPFFINTKNKKLTDLANLAMESLRATRAVEIVGEDMDIPKTISLIEIVKRQLLEEGRKCKQTNLIGLSIENRPCFKGVLKMEDQS